MYLNPVSYAHGLLDELEGALRAGRDEVVAGIRKELAALRKHELQFSEQQVKDMSDDGKIALASLRERLTAHDAADNSKPTEVQDGAGAKADKDAGSAPDQASGKGPARTAKAAAAPEAAVKPPAK